MKMREYAGLYTNSLDENENVDTNWQDLFLKTFSPRFRAVGQALTGGANLKTRMLYSRIIP